MIVADLQQLLVDLSKWLETTGGKQISQELSLLVKGLETHRERTLADFSKFLEQGGKTFDGSGLATKPTKAKPRVADPEKVRAAVQALRALLDRATEPDLTYESINHEIERLDDELNKYEGLEVAKEFGVMASVKSKIAALQEIGRMIADRKSMHDRTSRLGNPEKRDDCMEEH